MSDMPDTREVMIKVPRKEIVFIDMLFKAYEGLAMVTVDKKEEGLIILDVTEGTKDDVLGILKNLQEKIPLQIIK
ncbi:MULTISPECIES: DUF4911 domain-containing protein [Halanaerobiaceae]|nr:MULTISPECIES: DUF4911 domain-containing protein [Halanaerobiaceae]